MFFGYQWIGTLDSSGFSGEVAAILDPLIRLFFIICALTAWCLAVGLDWIRIRRMRRALTLFVVGALLIPTAIAGTYATEWISSTDSIKAARLLTEKRLQRLMDGEQTIAFAQAEERSFWADVSASDLDSS